MISLSEPFLGASIIPVLTDTGTTASAITRQSAAADQTNAAGTTNVYLATLIIGAPGTTIIANHLQSGAKLYSGECPMTSVHSATVAVGTTTLEINLDHDCHTDAISSDIVYRAATTRPTRTCTAPLATLASPRRPSTSPVARPTSTLLAPPIPRS